MSSGHKLKRTWHEPKRPSGLDKVMRGWHHLTDDEKLALASQAAILQGFYKYWHESSRSPLIVGDLGTGN